MKNESDIDNSKEIARVVYHRCMSIMKFTLDLKEQEHPDQGKRHPQFKFFKRLLMQQTYQNLRGLFEELSQTGLIQKTEYEEDVKNGYQNSISGGAGYRNVDELNEWLESE